MRLRRLDISDSPVVTEEVNCEVHLHFITTQYSVVVRSCTTCILTRGKKKQAHSGCCPRAEGSTVQSPQSTCCQILCTHPFYFTAVSQVRTPQPPSSWSMKLTIMDPTKCIRFVFPFVKRVLSCPTCSTSNSPERLLPHVKGNIGFVLTSDDLKGIRDLIIQNKVAAPARASAFIPQDFAVSAGKKGLACLGYSEGAGHQNMLSISPFTYGMTIQIFSSRNAFTSDVSDVSDTALAFRFLSGIKVIIAISRPSIWPLAPGCVLTESGHLICSAFRFAPRNPSFPPPFGPTRAVHAMKQASTSRTTTAPTQGSEFLRFLPSLLPDLLCSVCIHFRSSACCLRSLHSRPPVLAPSVVVLSRCL